MHKRRKNSTTDYSDCTDGINHKKREDRKERVGPRITQIDAKDR